MGAAVRIEPTAWNDSRFWLLARALNVDRPSAIGRMAAIWSECTDRETYVLDADSISVHLECDPEDVERLLCLRGKLGEAVPDGFRIKGTRGRIEWLAAKRAAGRKGGKASMATAKRDENGHFVSTLTQTGAEPEHSSKQTRSKAPSSDGALTEPTASAIATASATATENLSSASDDSRLSLGKMDWPSEARELKRRRHRCDKTLAELAIGLGCGNKRQLSKQERGLERPPDSVIVQWCKTLYRWEEERAAMGRCKANGEPSSDHKAFVDWFDPYFTEFKGGHPTWNGKTGKMVKDLLRDHSLEEVKRRAEVMFASVGEYPVTKIGHATLATLVQHFDMFTPVPGKTRGYSDMPTREDFLADQGKEF